MLGVGKWGGGDRGRRNGAEGSKGRSDAPAWAPGRQGPPPSLPPPHPGQDSRVSTAHEPHKCQPAGPPGAPRQPSPPEGHRCAPFVHQPGPVGEHAGTSKGNEPKRGGGAGRLSQPFRVEAAESSEGAKQPSRGQAGQRRGKRHATWKARARPFREASGSKQGWRRRGGRGGREPRAVEHQSRQGWV